MKRIATFVFVFLFASQFFAQSVSDCNGAIQLCEDVYTEANATSTFGNIFEPTGACNSGTETSSMWYTFTVTESGNMGFVLDPADIDADYDWGMFNITSDKVMVGTLTVTDASGRIIATEALNGLTKTIDLSSAVTGVYYFTISSDATQKVIRVIKN